MSHKDLTNEEIKQARESVFDDRSGPTLLANVARSTIPRALNELERLRQELAELRALKVVIKDKRTFEVLFVEQFHRYAKRKGWGPHLKSKSGNHWQHKTKTYGGDDAMKDHHIELAIPRKNGFADHAERLADALVCFSETEARPVLQILHEIQQIKVAKPQYLGENEDIRADHDA